MIKLVKWNQARHVLLLFKTDIVLKKLITSSLVLQGNWQCEKDTLRCSCALVLHMLLEDGVVCIVQPLVNQCRGEGTEERFQTSIIALHRVKNESNEQEIRSQNETLQFRRVP